VRVAWTAIDTQSGVSSTGATLDGRTTVYATGSVIPVAAGHHRLDVWAEDAAGNSSRASVSFDADSYTWIAPLLPGGAMIENAGRTFPIKFNVRRSDGTFVDDRSATLTLVNGAGRTVVGPLRVAASPDDGIAIEVDSLTGTVQYHGNVKTKGLAPGSYKVVVTFDSPTLVGEFGIALSLR
jgi:hypothetical protein